MISENVQIGLLGLAAIFGGIFVLVRRKSLAKANAKNTVGWTWLANRFNYSEEYFLMLNTAGGIFFILVGIASLIAAPFKNSEEKIPAPVEYLMAAIIGFVFVGGLIFIIFINFRFRKRRNDIR